MGRRAITKSIRIFSECFSPAGPVVEIGSYYSPGFEETNDQRKFFPGEEYIGCDIRDGPGVDRIEDAHALSFEDNSVGTLLMIEILEHLPKPDVAVREARRVLRDGGYFVMSVPFTYRLHGFPTDYWRFTASGVHQLLSCFEDKLIFSLGPRLKPAFTFAVATNRPSDSFRDKKVMFQEQIRANFGSDRIRANISLFKERARDLLGLLLGRAEIDAHFFDPNVRGGYRKSRDDQSSP
jgi:SAM-dependent methyltransferase